MFMLIDPVPAPYRYSGLHKAWVCKQFEMCCHFETSVAIIVLICGQFNFIGRQQNVVDDSM
jgi:hypothetical protein